MIIWHFRGGQESKIFERYQGLTGFQTLENERVFWNTYWNFLVLFLFQWHTCAKIVIYQALTGTTQVPQLRQMTQLIEPQLAQCARGPIARPIVPIFADRLVLYSRHAIRRRAAVAARIRRCAREWSGAPANQPVQTKQPERLLERVHFPPLGWVIKNQGGQLLVRRSSPSPLIAS